MAKHFVLELNLSDWDALHKKAQLSGFTNTREFVNAKMSELAEKANANISRCRLNNKQKKRNIYEIPEDQQELFNELACLHSASVSNVMFRYMIAPEIARVK